MLPARHRLRDSSQFGAVVRGPGAVRSGGPLIVVHAALTDPAGSRAARVGFVVPKSVGGSVVRHRTQRRLRHLMSDRLSSLPGGVDLVVRAQPSAAEADSGTLGGELDRLLRRVLPRVSAAAVSAVRS